MPWALSPMPFFKSPWTSAACASGSNKLRSTGFQPVSYLQFTLENPRYFTTNSYDPDSSRYAAAPSSVHINFTPTASLSGLPDSVIFVGSAVGKYAVAVVFGGIL